MTLGLLGSFGIPVALWRDTRNVSFLVERFGCMMLCSRCVRLISSVSLSVLETPKALFVRASLVASLDGNLGSFGAVLMSSPRLIRYSRTFWIRSYWSLVQRSSRNHNPKGFGSASPTPLGLCAQNAKRSPGSRFAHSCVIAHVAFTLLFQSTGVEM